MRRVLTIAILILLNFCLQSTLFGFHNIHSIKPNLLLILTMSFGVMRGRKEGLLVGFFCGLLFDIYFAPVIGGYTFLYMIIGYINGYMHKNFMIEDVMLPLIIILIDDFIFNFAVFVVVFLLHNHLQFKGYFVRIIFPEMLCTALLTIILYKVYVVINQYLKYKKEGKEAR